MSRKAGHSFLNARFQPITQWIQAGASSEWWPAELQAGLHRLTHLYYILSRIVGLLNLVIVATLTPEPSPAPEAAAFVSITSSTSCWNPSTVSSSWKRTSREIVADWLRWSTGGTRILRVGTKNEGSRILRVGTEKEAIPRCMLLSSKGLSGVGGRQDVGGGLGESAGEVNLREEDTKKELRVKMLGTARNDETMLLLWAMPPLPAARLAHIGWFGLGAFAEDEGKEHADTEEEERSNEDCVRNIMRKEDQSKTSLKNMNNHAYDFNMSNKVGTIWIYMDASWWKAGIQAAKKSWLPAGDIVGLRMDTGRRYTRGFVPAGVGGYGYGSRSQTRAQPVYPTRVPAGFDIWLLHGGRLLHFTRNRMSAASFRRLLCLGCWRRRDLLRINNLIPACNPQKRKRVRAQDNADISGNGSVE
ncbi:hypothetical protein C8J57DRAFT_1225660 [Mycena rebaudengoi]|nr:hypothetical protein C8J57DRAFT_1225660 [Mycena rebaudengoi]